MISFATVVYRGELSLLELQARSFARWVPDTLVTEIIIALNDLNLSKLEEEVEARRYLYGVHSSKLRILYANDLLMKGGDFSFLDKVKLLFPEFLGRRRRAGGWRGHPGWLIQQALKLSIGKVAVSPRTVLLDAKNIWLSSPYLVDFFTEDGRAKCDYIYGFSGKNQRAWFPPSLEALGYGFDFESLAKTTHFLTPFPIQSEVLRSAGRAVEENRGSIVGAFLFHNPHPTEFFILNAFVLREYQDLDRIFSDGLKICTPISANMNGDAIDRALLDARNGVRKSLALHSAAWRRFSQSQLDELELILKNSELI